MSKKINQLINSRLVSNTEILAKHAEAAKAWDAESVPMGDISHSRDVEFLIQIGLANADNPPAKDEVRKIISENVKPVLVLKRACAFELGGVLMVANRFGVITFNYLSELEQVLGGSWASMKTVRLESAIKEALGATVTGYDRSDRLYEYQVSTASEAA